MISIRQHLLSSGHIDPNDAHTSIPGIWQKLGEWYDLTALDEREDAVISDNASTGEDGDGGRAEHWRDFELPGGEFEEMMWTRRLATGSNVGSSPPATSFSEPIGAEARSRRRESTIADSDDPRSSPVSTSGLRSGRRGVATRGGRVNKLIADEVETGSGGRSRRSSKAASAAEPEDEEMEDDDDDEEGDESESGGAEDDDDGRRGNARKRGRGGNRGRGRKRR
jgi:MRG-binding protein